MILCFFFVFFFFKAFCFWQKLPECLKESYWLTWNFFGIGFSHLAGSRSFPLTSTSSSCLQAFVVFVTMCREAYDDFVRFRRDREVNSQQYKKLTKKGEWIVGIQNNNFCVSTIKVCFRYKPHRPQVQMVFTHFFGFPITSVGWIIFCQLLRLSVE